MKLDIQCRTAKVSAKFYSNEYIWVELKEVNPQSIDLEEIVDARWDDLIEELNKDRAAILDALDAKDDDE